MTNIVSAQSTPVLFVYLNTGVTGVTGNGTQYVVLYDTVGFGDSSNYNVGTGLYHPPVTGNYLISVGANFNNIINGGNNNLSHFSINGTTYRASECGMTALKTPANNFGFCVSFNFLVTVGQTIAFVGQIQNGSVQSVGMDGGTAPYLNWMFIRYLA